MAIAQKYTPEDIEGKWYQYWLDHKIFHSEPDERPAYTIVIPPPNVTGILHMGHMLNNTIQDALIRRKRMEGFNACWVPGTDHASIATEAKVVKMLREQGIKKSDLSRDDFLKHAWDWTHKYGGIILQQLKRLGASCDWDRTSFTMDQHYYDSVINVFVDLYDKGWIYRANRMVNWDPKGLTAISDEEVIYKEVNGKLYHIRYRIAGTDDQYLTIATTRPETILGDTAISVHPDDERYKHLVGQKALVPLINREIPIIADDYVEMEFGTGALKVTPAHDKNDFEIGERHKLDTIDILNANGTLSEAATLYVGEDRFKVRTKIAEDLEAAGHIVKIEDYRNQVGFSERTDAVIEPRLSLQWWLNMDELSKPAYKAVMEDTVQLIPAKFKNTYRHWMENIRHWTISRQLWWGHRIPAWYIRAEAMPEPTANSATDPSDDNFVVARNAEEALERARAKTGNPALQPEDLEQDPDVLDTWFSSWLWPIETFKGMSNPGNAEIKYYYPTNTLVTAPEILFFWVARMIIAGYEYQQDKPFSEVYLTGIVRDQKGRKMSKSLGNSPDVFALMDQYGADGVRFGILQPSPAGNDLIFDTPLKITLETPLVSAYCDQGKRFCNKIWQALRLVLSWETEDRPGTDMDKLSIEWMRARLDQGRQEINALLAQFRMSEALIGVYKLIWDEFCSWFLEMMKPPFGEKMATESRDAVVEIFEALMQEAHPFIPFLTEEVWQLLKDREAGESISLTRLQAIPETTDKPLLDAVHLIQETITMVRNFRQQKGIKNKEEIELYIKTALPGPFEQYKGLLKKFLNTSKIEFVGEAPEGSAGLHLHQHEFFIPMAGDIDVEGEIEKLKSEIDYTQGFLDKVLKKLSNERFVANAPEQVVAKERQKQEDAENKLKVLKEALTKLEN